MTDRIAILGLGLMGGSLGAALKARGYGGAVAGYARRAETREEALSAGVVDEAFASPGEAVAGADLVVCCVPILRIPALIEACRGRLRPGAVVTDVGSTKLELVEAAEAALEGTGALFVGSHPIAGSERQGLEARSADLYDGAVVIVTPRADDAPGLEEVRGLWTRLGSRVRTMDPGLHDRILARTSHLPHVVASALARAVGRDGNAQDLRAYCGTGFRDTSRVAAGSPEVWIDIVRTNKTELERELRAMQESLEVLRAALAAEDYDAVYRYLEEGRRQRGALTGTEGAES